MLLIVLLVRVSPAYAEPAIAVRTGYACSTCHLNRTGGGMRLPFGSLYAQTTLPLAVPPWPEDRALLPADPAARFAVGGDVRFQALNVNRPDGADVSSFEVTEANLYGEGRLIPGKLSLYLDLKAGPGGSSARELFALYAFERWHGYLKVGKFLPPFGWRLPDDGAFIRQVSGFTYSAPDIGVEAGIEPGRWSFHLAAVNGAGGGSDDNRSKRFSLLAARRFGKGRLGISGSNNITPGARVTQAGVWGGAGFGRLALLGEADWRESSAEGSMTRTLTALAEADLQITRGINLKFTHDWTDPDRDQATDARTRDSLGVELIPIPFVQLRLNLRRLDGPDQLPGTRDRQVELEAHLFF